MVFTISIMDHFATKVTWILMSLHMNVVVTIFIELVTNFALGPFHMFSMFCGKMIFIERIFLKPFPTVLANFGSKKFPFEWDFGFISMHGHSVNSQFSSVFKK